MKFTQNNDELRVVPWCSEFEERAYQLLNQYEETSLYLLSDMREYGTKLTDDAFSGNFKCVIKGEKVVAVFVLTKVGNLILQTDLAEDYSKVIIEECLKEPIPFTGVLGGWDLVQSIHAYAKRQLTHLKELSYKKEILFRIKADHLVERTSNSVVRHLVPADYHEWNQLNKAFIREQKLGQNESEESRHKRFLKSVSEKNWLGLFLDGHLVSTAAFTASINGVGLVGGVYTVPNMRQRGLAKALVYQLLLDGKTNKNMHKAILFTGEDNSSAIRLYESLGFERIGHFGLLFWENN